MPSFKDVVNFLNDPADVADHPFSSNSSTEAKPPSSERHTANDHKFAALTTEGYNECSENCVPAVKQERQKGIPSSSRRTGFASVESILLKIPQDCI